MGHRDLQGSGYWLEQLGNVSLYGSHKELADGLATVN